MKKSNFWWGQPTYNALQVKKSIGNLKRSKTPNARFFINRIAQKQEGLIIPSCLEKYIKGQRVVAYIVSGDDELYHGFVGDDPKELYGFLSYIGFIWDRKKRLWSLKQNAFVGQNKGAK